MGEPGRLGCYKINHHVSLENLQILYVFFYREAKLHQGSCWVYTDEVPGGRLMDIESRRVAFGAGIVVRDKELVLAFEEEDLLDS